MTKLARNFYARDAATVARELIGTILVRGDKRGRIVETEAYVGAHDLACHAAKGRTRRTEVMFGPAGHAYVYFIYGMHDMLNIVTGPVGDAQAVLVRAAEPLEGWAADLSGPGKLARAFDIKVKRDNGLDLTEKDLFILHDPRARPTIRITPRIGVAYARQWQHEPLRFIDANSPHVSGPRALRGLVPLENPRRTEKPTTSAARRQRARQMPKPQ